MVKHIANLITGCRILGSILLLFFPAFSAAFYILYLFCGFTDMLDGKVARKYGLVTDFGKFIDKFVMDVVYCRSQFFPFRDGDGGFPLNTFFYVLLDSCID